MPVLLPASLLSGVRSAAALGWAKAALAAAALAAAVGVAWQLGGRLGSAPPVSPPAPTAAAQRLHVEHCTEGAVLRHDVRWAAVCMVLAQQQEARHAACLADPAVTGDSDRGRGHCDRSFPARDGAAECELPQAQAGLLYDRLHREEQRCLAEAGVRRP